MKPWSEDAPNARLERRGPGRLLGAASLDSTKERTGHRPLEAPGSAAGPRVELDSRVPRVGHRERGDVVCAGEGGKIALMAPNAAMQWALSTAVNRAHGLERGDVAGPGEGGKPRSWPERGDWPALAKAVNRAHGPERGALPSPCDTLPLALGPERGDVAGPGEGGESRSWPRTRRLGGRWREVGSRSGG